MKKKLLVVMVLLLCLPLLACNKNPTPSEPNGTSTGVQVQKPDSIPASGWITRSDTYSEQFAFTESGFFFMHNQCLYYLDTATGYSVALCSKPGCLHGDSTSSKALYSCDAYVPGLVTVMFYHDGNLYYTIYEETGYTLFARSQDGTNLRKLAVLGAQYATSDTSVKLNNWVCAYGDLYYSMDVDTVVKGEDNSFIYSTSMYVLVKYDLSSGTEEELHRSEDELISLLCANDSMAVFYMTHYPTAEEIARPDYQEYINQFPAYLQLWHEESGGVSTLSEMDRSTTGSFVGFANGKIHMFGGSGTQMYAYDLALDTFDKSDLPEDVSRIWSEKYAGVSWRGYYDLENGTYYTNEYDTMQLPPGIDQFGASPVGFGKQGFVVLEMYIKDQRGVFNNFVYFPFDKMDDGIQLSDRIVFMRQDDEGYALLQPEA